MKPINRRTFLAQCTAGIGLAAAGSRAIAAEAPPRYLASHAEGYAKDPRAAALEWFRHAKFGLFMHFGLYSLLGRHEWVQFREKIPVAEYAKLTKDFTAKDFDADFITDLALDAGMKYVNITTRHHDSFCLFDSKHTDFKSTNTPAKRDLVAELAEQCHAKGLALFFYYSHGRDWRHPHAPNNDQWGGNARPKYETPDPAYAYGKDHDLQQYIAFMAAQIGELCTNYGPIAGIWLDGIATPASRPERVDEFHLPELYQQIWDSRPQVLVSYKQGLIGTEDFLAPERKWEGETGKSIELCDTLQPHGWGYIKEDDGKHKTPEQVMAMLETAAARPANLLLNTGPLPGGGIHPEDEATLRAVGKLLRA